MIYLLEERAVVPRRHRDNRKRRAVSGVGTTLGISGDA
jgi:hypothetical protein